MRSTTKKSGIAIAAIAVTAVAGAGVADAATAKSHRRHASRATSTASGNPAETLLTGDTATQAKAAAQTAVPGGTVGRATTEDSGDASGAAYEVHVTKSDGSEVEVLEDSTFKVLSTSAGRSRGGRG